MGQNNSKGHEAAGIPVETETPDLHAQVTVLSEKLAQAEKALEEKSQEVNDLMAINQDLQHEIERLTAVKSPAPVVAGTAAQTAREWQALRFTLDDTSYRFSFPAISFKDKRYTAAQVAADENLQRQMLEAGSRFFRPE